MASNRKHLSRLALTSKLMEDFETVSDKRNKNKVVHDLADALMAGFAMFTLKMPSLLSLDEMRLHRSRETNLQTLFGIKTVPSDTSMREILDEVDPADLRRGFTSIFRELQRGKALESFMFMQGKYLIAIDGTGYFSSDKVYCDSCLVKHSTKTEQTTYHHQMLSAVLIHPDQKVVIPLCPEAVIKQDGATKNDCERNASARIIDWISKEHDHLSVIVVEDGLASNAPHIRVLKEKNMSFILGAKPGDHKHLFEEFSLAGERLQRIEVRDDAAKKTTILQFVNGLPLNESNPGLLINFIYCEEISDAGKKLTFSWITDIEVTEENAYKISRGGRARWKIENETFNTLKNQGYGFEHNYGHGKKNLSTILAYLMMMAFLVDQTQFLTCKLTRAALDKVRRKSELFNQLRGLFDHFKFSDWSEIYSAIAYGYEAEITIKIRPTSTA